MGTWVAPDGAPAVRAANVDWRRSSVVPWHDGHSGVSLPRSRNSNWRSQVLQAYSNSGTVLLHGMDQHGAKRLGAVRIELTSPTTLDLLDGQ